MKTKIKTLTLYLVLFAILVIGLEAYRYTGDEITWKNWLLVIITAVTITVPAMSFWEPKVKKMLKIGEKETVEYKGKQYKILHQAKLKNPKTREWEDVVVYENGCGVYVREKEEFYERFK